MGTGVIDFGEDDDVRVQPSTSKRAFSPAVKKTPRQPKRVSFTDVPGPSGRRQKRQSAIHACELMVLHTPPKPVISSRSVRNGSVRVKEEFINEAEESERAPRRSNGANGFICHGGASPGSSTAKYECESSNGKNETFLYCRFCRWTPRSTLDFARHQREVHGLNMMQIDDVMCLAFDMPDFEVVLEQPPDEPCTSSATSDGRGTADFGDEPVPSEPCSPEL